MSLLALFVYIVCIGLIVWVINRFTPIDPIFKNIVLGLGILVVVILILSACGVLAHIRSVSVPSIR